MTSPTFTPFFYFSNSLLRSFRKKAVTYWCWGLVNSGIKENGQNETIMMNLPQKFNCYIAVPLGPVAFWASTTEEFIERAKEVHKLEIVRCLWKFLIALFTMNQNFGPLFFKCQHYLKLTSYFRYFIVTKNNKRYII